MKYAFLPVILASCLLVSTNAGAQDGCNTKPCQKVSADAVLKGNLDATTPLLLDRSNSNALMSATPQLEDTPGMQKLLDSLSAHAAKSQPLAHPSCAVVGNSQNLRGSGYGNVINAHDYVFRMNSAPVAGYEKDVGSKTTHHIFNYGTNYQIDGNNGVRMYGPDTINILIPLPAKHNGQPFHQQGQYGDYAPFFRQLAGDATMQGTPNLVVMHPAFVWYVNVQWFTPDRKLNTEAASKGLFTTVMAIHMCDSIDLYGFGADKNGKWGHYFGDGQVPTMHRAGYQEALLDYLEKIQVIRQFRGNAD